MLDRILPPGRVAAGLVARCRGCRVLALCLLPGILAAGTFPRHSRRVIAVCWAIYPSSCGGPIERLVAHFKNWKILHTDYRRPYGTYHDAFDAARGLFFFSITRGFE